MTNDIRKIKEHFCKSGTPELGEHQQKSRTVVEDYDKRLDTVKPGDKVEVIGSGNILVVDSIDGNKFFCKTGKLSGYRYFRKSEVKYIDKG